MLARTLLALLPFIFSTNFVFAKPISTQKRVLVDQILAINQTSNLVPLMSSSLTGKIIEAISRSRGPIDDDLKVVIHKEVQKAVHEQFVLNNKLNDNFYGLYDEYFSISQMQEIVSFYNSPAGKQLLKHSADISQRSMAQAKVQAKKVGPIVQERLLAIFDRIDEELKKREAPKE